MPSATPQQPPVDLDADASARFPTLEDFVESASEDDVQHLFDGLRTSLSQLKGPRVDQGKKVRAAIERTEELLMQLLATREKLASPQNPKR